MWSSASDSSELATPQKFKVAKLSFEPATPQKFMVAKLSFEPGAQMVASDSLFRPHLVSKAKAASSVVMISVLASFPGPAQLSVTY